MKIKKNVLVYDNQMGYYKMLVDSMSKDVSFVLYDALLLPNAPFDAITFFMNDELEAHDMALLRGMKLPFILATSRNGVAKPLDSPDIFHIDLRKTRDVLLDSIADVFNILQLCNKNKAPVL